LTAALGEATESSNFAEFNSGKGRIMARCNLKGVRPEWHLLKLFGVAMFANVRSGDLAWFGE
jgi:hypothetical protein